MAEMIGFPAWRHSESAVRAEWGLAREECARVAGMPVKGNEGWWLDSQEREISARERLLVVAGRV